MSIIGFVSVIFICDLLNVMVCAHVEHSSSYVASDLSAIC